MGRDAGVGKAVGGGRSQVTGIRFAECRAGHGETNVAGLRRVLAALRGMIIKSFASKPLKRHSAAFRSVDLLSICKCAAISVGTRRACLRGT